MEIKIAAEDRIICLLIPDQWWDQARRESLATFRREVTKVWAEDFSLENPCRRSAGNWTLLGHMSGSTASIKKQPGSLDSQLRIFIQLTMSSQNVFFSCEVTAPSTEAYSYTDTNLSKQKGLTHPHYYHQGKWRCWSGTKRGRPMGPTTISSCMQQGSCPIIKLCPSMDYRGNYIQKDLITVTLPQGDLTKRSPLPRAHVLKSNCFSASQP